MDMRFHETSRVKCSEVNRMGERGRADHCAHYLRRVAPSLVTAGLKNDNYLVSLVFSGFLWEHPVRIGLHIFLRLHRAAQYTHKYI